MIRVICNYCRKEEAPNEYGNAPKGWFTVSESGVYPGQTHYCSRSCVVAAHDNAVPITKSGETVLAEAVRA